MDPLTLIIKMCTTSHKIIQPKLIYLFMLLMGKNAKLYLLSTFQASDIELLSPRIETKYTSH